MFKGSMVALVTPMLSDGSIDKKALADLIEWHIEEKTEALIIAGTTGESATLNAQEQEELISFAIKQAAKRIPIVAGTGSNSTQHTLELTQKAKKIGADACLIVTPYYNKPPQNGLFEHYRYIACKVNLPIILYNVPGRTACDLLPETVERLAKTPNIVGIKEATGKIERVKEIHQRCGRTFDVYSGDDLTSLDLMLNGAQGVISVTANVTPAKMVEMCEHALAGKRELAEKTNQDLMPLHQKLFLEANPIPVKWALTKMGKIADGIRLPLVGLDAKYQQELTKALKEAGIQI